MKPRKKDLKKAARKFARKMLKALRKALKEYEGVIEDVCADKLAERAIYAALCALATGYGIASTGTPIAALSGAAFNSATLAFVGGGSMVVGGIVLLVLSHIAGKALKAAFQEAKKYAQARTRKATA